MSWWHKKRCRSRSRGWSHFNQGPWWKEPRWPNDKIRYAYLCLNFIMSCRMVADNVDHYIYLKKHDRGKRISSSERMQKGISRTRWNQHNMSSYKVWGGWLRLQNLIRNLEEWNVWERKRSWPLQPWWKQSTSKDQEELTRKSPEKIWRLWWKFGKDRNPWQHISLGRFVNMNARCWYLQKDVMMKSPLVRYNLS